VLGTVLVVGVGFELVSDGIAVEFEPGLGDGDGTEATNPGVPDGVEMALVLPAFPTVM